ncbi:UxaA family hydrolase, partial [Arsenicibacter rosenii]|uniref:UxaA family hydrolase n=1 Tax=Arsenicibacter rosenii TaxID=1750698 RepID=UPI001C4348BE
MDKPTNNNVIKTTPQDNVAIVANPQGLPRGTRVLNDIVLTEDIPMGHKVALVDFSIGDAVLRYGHIIGYAKTPVSQGSWVNEFNIGLPQPPALDEISYTQPAHHDTDPLEGYTFEGFRNADG